MSNLLEFLQWFGEEATQLGSTIHTLASAAQQAPDDMHQGILDSIPQTYLVATSDQFLDRWGWDLLRMQRRPLESDETFRQRIITEIYRAKGTRRAMREMIQLLTGQDPVEIFEPARNSAYFGVGHFMWERDADRRYLTRSACQIDGTGEYIPRMGSMALTYSGFLKVTLPTDTRIGNGLYYESAVYCSAGFFIGEEEVIRPLATKEEITLAIDGLKVAGTKVHVEFCV